MLARLLPEKGHLLEPYGTGFIQASFAKPRVLTFPDNRTEWQPIDRLEGSEIPVTELTKHSVTDNSMRWLGKQALFVTMSCACFI